MLRVPELLLLGDSVCGLADSSSPDLQTLRLYPRKCRARVGAITDFQSEVTPDVSGPRVHPDHGFCV